MIVAQKIQLKQEFIAAVNVSVYIAVCKQKH